MGSRWLEPGAGVLTLGGWRRRGSLVIAAAAVVLGALTSLAVTGTLTINATAQSGTCSTAAATASNPAVFGCWTIPPIPLGTVGINSALMPNGNVLLYGLPENAPGDGPGSDARVLNPNTGQITNVTLTSQTDILCSGIDVLPNGEVLATGGLLYNPSDPYVESTTGTNNITLFDPATNTWSSGGNLLEPRWYPSNVELANGDVLIFGGQASTGNFDNNVELFSGPTQPTQMMPGTSYFGNYPRLFLLPDGMIAKVGPSQYTRIYNPQTGSFSGNLAAMNYGNREYGAFVLLPGLNQILAAGGSAVGTQNPTATAELLNLSTMRWSYTGSMHSPRINENLVLLPTGNVLSVGGGAGGLYGNPVTSAEMYSPATGQWSVMASQTAQRTYHSTAILLPNGQVLSAGSDNGPNQNSYELYSPPYLFQGARPTISGVPTSVGYGSSFTVTTPDASSISKVALISSGAATHATNPTQRYVALNFSAGSGQLTVSGPANGDTTPPGWYMMFLVNSAGVPSVASWVDVGAAPSTAAATNLVVSGLASTVAGSPASVTVTAETATGAVAANYQGTVDFSSSDQAAVLPSPYAFTAADGGTHTFTVQFNTTGSQTLTVSDSTYSSISGSASVMVTQPSSVSSLSATLPASSQAGVDVPLTVQALGANGSAASGYQGTVDFTSSDPAAVLPAPYTFTQADQGSHTFQVTLNTRGTEMITVTDAATSSLTGSASTTVTLPATHFALYTPSTIVAGKPFHTTIVALDRYNGVVPGYVGTVNLTSSDPGAQLPPALTFTAAEQGRAVVSITLNTAGGQTLSVQDVADGSISGQRAVTVSP